VRARIVAAGEDYREEKRSWSTRTDAEGRFEWNSAPPSQTNYQIAASGYRLLNQALLPNGVEHRVFLERKVEPKPWRVGGRVQDANSRRPIQQFEVWVATTVGPLEPARGPRSIGFAAQLKTTGTNGGFSFLALDSYAGPVDKLDLEIRSEGYLPANKTISGPLTNRVWLGFDLESAPAISGTVQLPDGRPATGAVVMLAGGTLEKRGHMHLPRQFDLQLSSAAHTDTDEQGRFSLPAKSMVGILLAAHRDGYAELDLQKSASSPGIRLQPWGEIKGTLRSGSLPAPGRTVTVGNDYDGQKDPSPYLLALTAMTDAEGAFVFDGVPPGDWRIEPHHERVRVRAGETTQIVLGGGGVKLVGPGGVEESDSNRRRAR
jgi:hypothetical protein